MLGLLQGRVLGIRSSRRHFVRIVFCGDGNRRRIHLHRRFHALARSTRNGPRLRKPRPNQTRPILESQFLDQLVELFRFIRREPKRDLCGR